LLCRRANFQYIPKPYPAHITMFASAGNFERQKADWGPLTHGGGLTVVEIPGGHTGMLFPPYSKMLAEHLDACLAAAGCAQTKA
jgi:hypothetical protein